MGDRRWETPVKYTFNDPSRFTSVSRGSESLNFKRVRVVEKSLDRSRRSSSSHRQPPIGYHRTVRLGGDGCVRQRQFVAAPVIRVRYAGDLPGGQSDETAATS